MRECFRIVTKGNKKKTKLKDDCISASDEFANILNVIQRAAEGDEGDGKSAEIDALIDDSKNVLDASRPHAKRGNHPKSAAKKAKPKRVKRVKESDADSDDDEENRIRQKPVRINQSKEGEADKQVLRKIENTFVYGDDDEDDY